MTAPVQTPQPADEEIIPLQRHPFPVWDDRDHALVRAALDARRQLVGPQVGDWIEFTDGLRRISHVWGEETAQTEDGIGSIHLSSSGHGSYSGSLDPGVPILLLTPTGDILPSRMWIFHHVHPQAHWGVDFTIPTRVYRYPHPRSQRVPQQAGGGA